MSDKLTLVCHCPYSGTKLEEQWYRGDVASAEFGVTTTSGRWLNLIDLTIPRPLTTLVPDRSHPVGYQLQLNVSWPRVEGFDFAPFIDCFPRKIASICALSGQVTRAQLEQQRLVQFAGWMRLVAIYFATGPQKLPLRGLETQAAFWEEYLFEELCDYPWLCARQSGKPSVLAQPRDRTQFRSWLKIASCTAEILWRAPEGRTILAAARVAPQLFPCLAVGLAEARHYGGIA